MTIRDVAGALAQKEMPCDPMIDSEGRTRRCAPQLDDGRPSSVHELLNCHKGRHNECECHRNRHAGGNHDDVEGEVASQLTRKVVVHCLGQDVHLDDEGKEEDGHQGEAEGLGDGVVDVRDER